MSEGDLSLRHHLLDPEFWRPRLQRLAQVPRKLVLCPRPDLSRAGIEVLEMRLQAHDGTALRVLVGRSAFARRGESVRVRPGWPGVPKGPRELDWASLEQGTTDVVLSFGADRRLEDRVLDVIRTVEAACSLESVPCSKVRLGWDRPTNYHDAFTLAGMIRDQGWIEKSG